MPYFKKCIRDRNVSCRDTAIVVSAEGARLTYVCDSSPYREKNTALHTLSAPPSTHSWSSAPEENYSQGGSAPTSTVSGPTPGSQEQWGESLWDSQLKKVFDSSPVLGINPAPNALATPPSTHSWSRAPEENYVTGRIRSKDYKP